MPKTDTLPDAPERGNTPPVEEIAEVTDEFVYVRLANGDIKQVPRKDIVDAVATEKQDLPENTTLVEPESHYYVHLANGDIVRVTASDLPTSQGTNAPNGHWKRGNEVHYVTGIYPVETIGKE